jgi:predicted DNA-binding transcriptional regulator AlpA
MAKPHSVKLERPGGQRRHVDVDAELKPVAANVEQHGPRGPPAKPPKSTDNLDAFSIPEFCRRHGFSRGTFYNLKKLGQGPRETHIGKRIIITREAAAVWLRKQEQKSA